MRACYVIKHLWLCSLHRTMWPGYTGTTIKTSDCSEYPKISLLQSSLPKKYLPNFPTQKNAGIENVKSKKKTFNHRHGLEIRISPCPAGL